MAIATIIYVAATPRDVWTPHEILRRDKLHHNIEVAVPGAAVEVTLALQNPGHANQFERIHGRRTHNGLVQFARPSRLYPGLLFTPFNQFTIQEVGQGARVA